MQAPDKGLQEKVIVTEAPVNLSEAAPGEGISL